jgi:preprotein translocase subunit SecB
MIAQRSDLILERFVVVESHLSMIISEDITDLKPDNIQNSYPVDIDFSLEQDNYVDLYRIVTAIEINNCENKKPGYSIAVTGMGFFKFSPDTKLNEEQKVQMLQTSGLSICITNLRSYIANQTSYLPWGSYSFYAVDVQALLKEKQKRETDV